MAEIVKIGEEEILLDRDNLKFDESNLSEYLEKEGGWYDYFGKKLADAEFIMQRYEMEYESLYATRFKEFKEGGCGSDKLAEAKATADADVIEIRKNYLNYKHKVRLLQNHLKAWDKCHENAQSRGHFLRKEMDKLNRDIKVEEIIKYER